MKELELDLRKIAAQIEQEYGMGGLSGTVYEDYAVETAKRVIAELKDRGYIVEPVYFLKDQS